MGGIDREARELDRGLEAEGAIDPHHVVVDRLRDADDRDSRPPAGDLVGDRVRAAEGSVAADGEEDLHVVALERIDHDRGLVRPAGSAEARSAAVVDVADEVEPERDRSAPGGAVEAGEAVAKPEHVPHPVAVAELEDDGADDVVQPGAEAAAGHEGGARARGVEEDSLARACLFERERVVRAGDEAALRVEDDARVIGGVAPGGNAGSAEAERRGQQRGPQRAHDEVGRGGEGAGHGRSLFVARAVQLTPRTTAPRRARPRRRRCRARSRGA